MVDVVSLYMLRDVLGCTAGAGTGRRPGPTHLQPLWPVSMKESCSSDQQLPEEAAADPASVRACRAVRGLSVVEVVPLDALLGALGSDARPVAERLHRLLLPSYFPGPEEGPACVAALLRHQPEVPTCSHRALSAMKHASCPNCPCSRVGTASSLQAMSDRPPLRSPRCLCHGNLQCP